MTWHNTERMTIRQRWKRTALHNKALTLATIFYAGTAAWQVHLMNRISAGSSNQVDRLAKATNDAINKAITASTSATQSAIAQNEESLKSALAENDKSIQAQLAQSKSALDATVTAYRLDQRPWIGVKSVRIVDFEKGKPLKVAFDLFNSGKTPATLVTSATKFKGSEIFVTGPQSDWPMNFKFAPDQSLAPQAGFASNTTVSTELIKDTVFDAIKAKTLFMYFYGEVRYTDTLGKTNGSTEFCAYLGFDGPIQTNQTCTSAARLPI